MASSSCLHCQGGNKVQVSCDSCQSYICVDCHWCHEFQANHEIRVCDRCDSFLCKECEDMDQCHDCGEVVCKSCGTLMTCKFCGSALCDECATSCAKCGIVLCGRDAKFAVNCDTCKLSYCLVCLASGQKEACIRCNARPSKRMEQLVHLRLKSIYKAFQQSARTNDVHPNLKRVTLASMKNVKEIQVDPILAQANADLAAAELLAELEKEEECTKHASKKKRKKKRKGHIDNGHKKVDDDQNYDEKEQCITLLRSREKARLNMSIPTSSQDQTEMERHGRQIEDSTNVEQGQSKQEESQVEPELDPTFPTGCTTESPDEPWENQHVKSTDPIQSKLCALVNCEDVDGISLLLEELKGIPGMGALRKNAKKALKRLKDQRLEQPQPRVRVLSTTSKSLTAQETLLEMDPSIVGFVIGKGGQKIRDLMDESGAKVWIDQESMTGTEPRIAYVSGAKKAVDAAVKMIQEIVKDADNQDSCLAFVNSFKPNTSESKPTQQSVVLTKEEIACDARFVPLLIGRRGWTIKHIQDSSGAKVDIDQSVSPKLVKITGSPEAVATAKRLIGDVLSYPHAQLKSNADDAESFAMDEQHSPPPSKFVMTGDAKSIVSASSSLSSTPEPSMASSKGQDHVVAPPGLFDNCQGPEGTPIAPLYAQSEVFFKGDEFGQCDYGELLLQRGYLHHSHLLSSPGPEMEGMMHHQNQGPHPFFEPQTRLLSARSQQIPSLHPYSKLQTMQNCMSRNPALVSQQLVTVHPHYDDFITFGTPNDHAVRNGLGKTSLIQAGDSWCGEVPLVRRTDNEHFQGPIQQPLSSPLMSPPFRVQPYPCKQSIAPDVVGNGRVPCPPDVSLSTAKAIQENVPLAGSGARDESYLIDSMFFASSGSNDVISAFKGLSMNGDQWENPTDIPEWNRKQNGHTTIQQPNESRFHWGS